MPSLQELMNQRELLLEIEGQIYNQRDKELIREYIKLHIKFVAWLADAKGNFISVYAEDSFSGTCGWPSVGPAILLSLDGIF